MAGGSGTWMGVAFVWASLAASLLPFFALREIGQVLGEDRLWALTFHRDARGEIARPDQPRPSGRVAP